MDIIKILLLLIVSGNYTPWASQNAGAPGIQPSHRNERIICYTSKEPLLEKYNGDKNLLGGRGNNGARYEMKIIKPHKNAGLEKS